MPRMLTETQIAKYRRENYLSPLQGITSEKAEYYRRCLDAYEAEHGGHPLTPKMLRKTHVLLPWVADMVRERRILDAVEDVIGPDILIFNSTYFIKEAHSDMITAWHQDSTHFGLRPHEHVSAWLALSVASSESGCMEVVSGSSALGQLRHRPQALKNSINAGSQAIVEEFDAEPIVPLALAPGQFSLHHTRVVHRSEPNRSDDRRIGIGISYIPARLRHIGSHRMTATLVRGEDRFGHFDLEPDPRALSPEDARAAHDFAYRRYREGYDEQIEWHKAEYGDPTHA